MLFALPANAAAAPLTVAGIELNDGYCLVDNEDTSATEGNNDGNYVAYYKDTVLHLKGLNINMTAESINGIKWDSYSNPLTIELTGSNKLKQENGVAGIAISSPASNLVITGDGTLEIIGGNNGIWLDSGGITISGSTKVTVTDNTGSGISCFSLTVSDSATLAVTGSNHGIWVRDNTTISGSAKVTVTGNGGSGIYNKGGNAALGKTKTIIQGNAVVNIEGTTYGIGGGSNTIVELSGDCKFIAKGGTAALQKAPASINYTTRKVFASASIDGDDLVVYKNENNGNYRYVKVQAKTEPPFVLTFNTDGGSVIAPIIKDEPIIAPDDPTKEGYTFAGWTDNSEGAVAFPITMPAEDMEITAQWTVNQYTITFDTDGGSEIAAITQDYGTAITAPSNPTKEGYTFAGWDTEIPATMPAEDMTVTAQWDAIQYRFTFNTNGGTAIDPIVAPKDAHIIAPADPTKEGYTFVGWDKQFPLTMPAENRIFNAQWIINQYTITFDTDGGSEIAAITQDYDTAITAPSNPTKEGYTFAGWDPEIPTKMPAEDMTVTAQWDAIQYTITFDTDGGTSVAPIMAEEGAPITAPAAPTKEGYTFDGWDTEIPTTMPAQNMEITAQWTINQYTIIFNTDGGSVIAPITQDYGTAITAPAAPTKEGYTFAGWSPAIPATMPAQNMTITALWRENSGGGDDYYTPSDTVTSTTQNSDGSVTETTVDKTTGTTTTVTTKPDGAKVTVEEKKDGSVTTIEETTIGKVTTDIDGKGNIKSEVELNFDRATDINLPIRDYSDIAKLTVTYEDGTKVDIIDFKKTADGIKINIADDCSVAFNKVVPHNFTDLASDHWATKDIDYISSTGLMRGMTATNFEPNVTLTRGMLVTILYRLENEPAVNTNMGFIDVDLAQYYAKAVAWAKANGIVNGVSEDRFAPDSQITREQMAAIMCNYAEHKGYDISVGENTNILSYDDFSNISEYAI
ncbi:MAG: InlB B-repeat-containing protein, partial [Peptococcaceae bacterium]|nr:InlB B-repeat-containing protein [Peptococcaceae bacterium]